MINNIWVITQYTLRESLKNRIFWIAGVFAIIGIAAASFVGDFAIIETRRTEVAVLSSFYRFVSVFAMMIFVISTMVREFNDKCLELYLSFPISRMIYFIGKLAGFFFTGFCVSVVYAAVLLLYAEPIPVLFWMFSLVCELMIVVSLGFFCVMTFNQQLPASMVTTFFFYMFCRISDSVVLISESDLVLNTLGALYLRTIIEWVVYVLPSLGRFTNSEWLVYNDPAIAELSPLLLGQTLIFVVLLGAATFFDFTRKNL